MGINRRIIFFLSVLLLAAFVLSLIIYRNYLRKRPVPQEQLPYVQELQQYYEWKKTQTENKVKFSGTASPSAQTQIIQETEETDAKVQGSQTQSGEVLGEVLGADGSSYLQYIPLPGVTNFSTDAFTGTATISYPLNLPAGPGGYTPGLSLSYSSGNVDELLHGVDTKLLLAFTRQSGPLGLGWSLSESGISIDTHKELNPCFWTYKISFPGGSGEIYKVDAGGNKIAKCYWGDTDGDGTEDNWVLTNEWKSSGDWRTNPEMFLKIQTGFARDLLPADADFANLRDIWKITTPDNTVYAFGSGGELGADSARLFNYMNVWYHESGMNGCGSTTMGWKLFKSVNTFGAAIKYSYEPVFGNQPASWCKYGPPLLSSRLREIIYGPNRVSLIYGQTRQDTTLVYDGVDRIRQGNNPDRFWAQSDPLDEDDQYIAHPSALSAIETYADNQLVRKYRFSYYDSWTASGGYAHFNYAACIPWSVKYYIPGTYALNDGLTSYHLQLKSIQEQIGSDANNVFPAQTYTYQNLPYHANYPCTGSTYIEGNANSLYLKEADNGYGGKTRYEFDPERLADKIYEANGSSYFDNEDYFDPKMNQGLRRARIRKTVVFDGIGNASEQLFDYGAMVPVTVLTADVLGRSDGRIFDYNFVGYSPPSGPPSYGHSSVTVYSGKKYRAGTPYSINPTDPKTWLSKNESSFHQVLFSSGCFKKDPRSGMAFRNYLYDEHGMTADSISFIRFKNISDLNDQFPASNESCTDIPAEILPLTLRSEKYQAKQGVAGNLRYNCRTVNPVPDYCNNITISKNEYQWNFAVSNNPEQGNFAGLTKSETFLRRRKSDKSGYEVDKKMSSSETRYVSQGFGISNTTSYLLNLPTESWINNPDDAADTKKYKWQRIYYDGQAHGALSPAGKGLATASETLLSDGTVAGRNESAYDSFGNIVSTKDGKGNVSSITFDSTFHAFPTSATNALNQTASTQYDFVLGVPLSTTDLNGKVIKFTYDNKGRLTSIYTPQDNRLAALPTSEFEYHLNENAVYGVPLAVQTYARTKAYADKDDGEVTLTTFDLYDGLGNKVQSQSLIDGKVHTSWGDQDPGSLTNTGLKSFTSESFAYDPAISPFGKLNRSVPSTAKMSFMETNISGTFTKATDINGNISYSLTNPEGNEGDGDPFAKTVSAKGVYSLAKTDPIARTAQATTCKDPGSTDEATIVANRFSDTCPTSAKITSSTLTNFLGIALETKDTTGKILSSVDQSGFDSLGRVLVTEDADLGKSYIDEFDLNGNVVKTRDAAGTAFENVYDSLNRAVTLKVMPKGGTAKTVTTLTFDTGADGKSCGTTPLGKVCKKSSLDNFGREIRTYYQYDDLGNMVEEEVVFPDELSAKFGTSAFTTKYTYDALGRLASLVYPHLPNTQSAETVTFTYRGPYLTGVSGDQVYVSDVTYDDFGRMTSVSLGNSKTETYTYDENRRLSAIQAPDVLGLGYTYENSTGLLTQISDSLSYQDPSLSKFMGYEYDNLGRLTRAYQGTFTFQGAQNTYTYDDMNNLTAKTEADKSYAYTTDASFPYHGIKSINGGPAVSYDELGRMTGYEVPGEYTIGIAEFDPNSGKPQKINYATASATLVTEVYNYDSDGRRIGKAQTDEDGNSSNEILYVSPYLELDLGQKIIRKNYFAAGRLVAVSTFGFETAQTTPSVSPTPTVSEGKVVLNFTINGALPSDCYIESKVINTDINRELTQKNQQSSSNSIQIETGNITVSVSKSLLDINTNSACSTNPISDIQFYACPGTISEISSGTSSAISCGNFSLGQGETIPLDIVVTLDQQIPTEPRSLFGSSNNIISLAVDLYNQGILRIQDFVGQLTRTPSTQKKTCDPLLGECNTPLLQITILPSPTIDPAVFQRYGTGPYAGSATGTTTTGASGTAASPHTYFLHTDHLGSLIAITDETGKIVEQRKYEPYGREAATYPSASSGQATERGYTGQIQDQTTGLYYYNARYYDPVLSRFISADSVNDLANRYSYVGGNPVMASDPSGNMMWAGDGGGGGGGRRGTGGANQGSTPSFNFPAAPLGYTSVPNYTRNLGGISAGSSVAPEWAMDVSDITQGFMQAGVGMLMAPGKSMIRDWDLFWNKPGGVLEKAFLAADFVMMGGLWGYGEYSAANPNASFGERMGQAVLPGLQITAMIGPKIVPGISRGVRNIYWQNQLKKSIAAVESSGVKVFQLEQNTFSTLSKRLSGDRYIPSGFYMSEKSAKYFGFPAGIYMKRSIPPLERLSTLLHEYTHHLLEGAFSNPSSTLTEIYPLLAETAAPWSSSALREGAALTAKIFEQSRVVHMGSRTLINDALLFSSP